MLVIPALPIDNDVNAPSWRRPVVLSGIVAPSPELELEPFAHHAIRALREWSANKLASGPAAPADDHAHVTLWRVALTARRHRCCRPSVSVSAHRDAVVDSP